MKMALPIGSYYYRRLFLYVLLVSMSAVLVLSILFYARVKQDLTEQFLQDNLSILQKSSYSIESVHDTVSTLMATLGKNTDIQRIMYGNNPDDEMVFRTIINLKNNVLSHYAFIKHLYVYNDRNGKVYSTRGNFTSIPEDLAPLITGENPARYLRPYYHILPGNSESVEPQTVVTYCIYEYTDANGTPQGALLVDISLEWLSAFLVTDRPLQPTKGYFEGVIAIDGEDRLLNENAAAKRVLDGLMDLPLDPLTWRGSMSITPVTIDEQEYLVTSLPVHATDWSLVRFQLADNTYRALLDWQQRLIRIIILCIGIILMVDLFVVKRVYKPVQQLIQRAGSTGSIKDEFKYLENVFVEAKQEASTLRKSSELSSKRKAEQECWLRVLEGHDSLNSCLLPEWGDGPHFVCLATISHYNQIKKKLVHTNEILYRFSLLAMLRNGILPPNLCIEIREDLIAMILPSEQFQTMMVHIKSVMEQVDGQLKSRIVFAYSLPVASLCEISIAYHQAVNILKYRYLFDDMQVLSPDDVTSNEQNAKHAVDPGLFPACKEAIYCNKADDVRKCMADFHLQLSELAYADVVVELMRLIAYLRISVEEWNAVRLDPLLFDASELINDVFESESLHHTMNRILHQVMALAEAADVGLEHRIDERVDIYREYILKNLSQPELTGTSVAEYFSVSIRQMNRLFKRVAGSTVSEFITDSRLQLAAKMLVESDHKAKDIALTIGFDNTNYFYTLFKKKYGVTPKEYQLANRARPYQHEN